MGMDNRKTSGGSFVAALVFFVMTASIAIFLLLTALVVWLSEVTGSFILSSLIVGGFFAVLAAVIYLLAIREGVERIGDQASDIAELVLHLHAKSTDAVGVLEDILKMGDDVLKMVKRSIAAYVQVDLAVAAEVIAHDDVIDAAFARISSEIAQYIAAHPTEAETALDLFMVTKYLERLGDHAVNVAEWVEFLKTGVHKSRKIV